MALSALLYAGVFIRRRRRRIRYAGTNTKELDENCSGETEQGTLFSVDHCTGSHVLLQNGMHRWNMRWLKPNDGPEDSGRIPLYWDLTQRVLLVDTHLIAPAGCLRSFVDVVEVHLLHTTVMAL